MGLDMYLTERIYVGNQYCPEFNKDPIRIAANHYIYREGEREMMEREIEIPGDRLESIVLSAGYWRKANQIHHWFVHNVQDGLDECQETYVSYSQLQELRKLCQKVIDNPKLAPNLLPSQSGFFFGDTEYDEYYFQDLKDTIEIIDRLKDGGDYYYQSSW